jgi:Ca-activated chloride channel homolog
MKFCVAFLLVLAIFCSGTVTEGQTAPQKAKPGAVPKPRTQTIRVCQGVPIPEGYVIIAYMTSAACPHGAYVLKKQDDYESSLAVNAGARQPADEPAEPTKTTAGKRTSSTPRPTGPSNTASRKSTPPQGRSTQPAGNAALSTASTSTTRPRRVGSTSPDATHPQSPAQSRYTPPLQNQSQSANQEEEPVQTPSGPPTLIGGEPIAKLGPPKLNQAGAPSVASTDNASPDVSSPPGPEEVGEGDVLRVDTALVTVPVSVLDRQGRFIANLKREDFRVFENGVEQSIAYFEPSEKPFTVALLLDTSASTHFHLWEIKEAAINFAKQLRPQDRVLIVSFNDQVLLLSEVTNDMNLIETVIEENANTGNSTRLYDAVDLTIKERLTKIKGRKAIVLFTDGVDTSSQQADYHGTLREVEELDALIYPIQYDTTDYMNAMQGAGNGTVTVTTTTRGIFGARTSTQTYNVNGNNGAPPPGSTKEDYERADRYLHALADKTGGRLYQANDTTQLAQAFTSIAEELRRQYSLGYYPKTNNGESKDGRRQIRVRVRQPNLAVKARDSYVRSTTASPEK